MPKYLVEDKKTGEIYEGHQEVLVDQICNRLNLLPPQAEAILKVSTDEQPLYFMDCRIWRIV